MKMTARNWLAAGISVILTALFLIPLTGQAEASAGGRRMALVIGNGEYTQHPLKNPVSDARDVAAALRSVDFEVVDGFNLSFDAMNDIIAMFLQRADSADVVLFYYAGHGFQLNATNYIVPSDAQFSNAAALKARIFDVQKIINSLTRKNHTTLVFLDACRDNPFDAAAAAGQATSRSTAGAAIEGSAEGFAEMTAAPGTFISFSTEPRKVALDGNGRNSPYAQALVKHIGQSNQSISDLMIAVRKDVQQLTLGRQTPWDQSSLTNQFYFRLAALDQPAVPLVSDGAGGLFGNDYGGGLIMDSQSAGTRATETGVAPDKQSASLPQADAIDHQDRKNEQASGRAEPQGTVREKTKSSSDDKRPAQRKAGQKKPEKKAAPNRTATQKKRKPALPPDVAVGVGIGGL